MQMQPVGKLRVRLSTLWPNIPLTAELPLLGERSKGAHVAGSIAVTLHTRYASTVSGGQGAWRGARRTLGWRRRRAVRRRPPAGSRPPPASRRSPPLATPRSSQGALVRGYIKPALPAAAYSFPAVADKAQQAALARESRRLVLRWLDSANPAIASAQALVVLDAER